MNTHKRTSVIPIYLVGLTWLVYALLFPLNAPLHYGLCAVLSLVAFVIGKAIFPDKVYQTSADKSQAAAEKEPQAKEQPKKEEPPKDPQVAALMKERDRAVSEMRRLNDAIQDEKISAQIDHLEEVTGKILDQVIPVSYTHL